LSESQFEVGSLVLCYIDGIPFTGLVLEHEDLHTFHIFKHLGDAGWSKKLVQQPACLVYWFEEKSKSWSEDAELVKIC